MAGTLARGGQAPLSEADHGGGPCRGRERRAACARPFQSGLRGMQRRTMTVYLPAPRFRGCSRRDRGRLAAPRLRRGVVWLSHADAAALSDGAPGRWKCGASMVMPRPSHTIPRVGLGAETPIAACSCREMVHHPSLVRGVLALSRRAAASLARACAPFCGGGAWWRQGPRRPFRE